MSVQPKPYMDVDEFLDWAKDRPGRHELVDGEVHAMSPQRARHARAKYRIQAALDRAIAAGRLSCEMLPDGMTVKVDATTAYEPDALVQCGERAADDAVTATHPIIVVEVLSPGTQATDTGEKLGGYFKLASVMHYLIVDPRKRLVIHHRRGEGELIETRIVSAGSLDLTPPGLSLSLAEAFADL
ncbi:Uma2 family endonuclease [Methylobacterium sp. sgz302541]|uniref:Uma2 family endonuclease n=1 Tax=unclassified Methylobacterium TaxID=2615210 RepID=UPI003D34C973